MKSKVSNLFSRNISLWFWMPLVAPILAILIAVCLPGVPVWLGWGLSGVFVLGIIYFLGMTIAWFCRKRWKWGLFSMLCGLLIIGSLFPAVALRMMMGFMDVDNFNQKVSLPSGIALPEPVRSKVGATDEPDAFSKRLMASLESIPSGNAALKTAMPELEALALNHKPLLERYLQAHPGWKVYEDRGSRFAVRRWKVDGHWEISLNGYYSDFSSPNPFQSRTEIVLAGKPWASRHTQVVPRNSSLTPVTKLIYGGKYESRFAFPLGNDVMLDLFEQSPDVERRLSKATIDYLEKEFLPLAKDPTWETAQSLLPADAVISGKPSFQLRSSGSGGIYNGVVRANAGEPGRVYLKVFEMTQGIELSKRSVEERSSEWIGWSANRDELFLGDVNFTIYEGDWGNYYGARFEVWFDPDSGAPERKLLESKWKIEGWSR